MARSHFPEKYVGQKVVPEFWQHVAASAEGVAEVTTLEGIEATTPYSRSTQSGWTVAIAIPRQGLEAPLRSSLWVLAMGAAILLALGMVAAGYFGGRIAAAVLALRTAAVALGSGAPLGEPSSRVRETAEVAQAMNDASQVLRSRTAALAGAHELLLVREADLSDAQRIAQLGSWFWDARTDVLTASPEMCRIFGLHTIPGFAR